ARTAGAAQPRRPAERRPLGFLRAPAGRAGRRKPAPACLRRRPPGTLGTRARSAAARGADRRRLVWRRGRTRAAPRRGARLPELPRPAPGLTRRKRVASRPRDAVAGAQRASGRSRQKRRHPLPVIRETGLTLQKPCVTFPWLFTTVGLETRVGAPPRG